MRVVYDDLITDEMREAFNTEESIYLSSDGSAWLFTDMKVFNKLDKKFQFDVETDERESVYNVSIENYISNTYEETVAEYFGFNIEFAGYDVSDVCEDNVGDLCDNEWDKTIDAWMKADVILEIKIEMQETLKKMLHDGYDIAELKSVVEDVMYREGNK